MFCIQHSQEWVMSLMEEQNNEHNKASLDEWLREPQVLTGQSLDNIGKI